MGRRIVPGVFWSWMVMCVILLAAGLGASGPGVRVPKVQGAWDGFFLESDNALLGRVRSDITSQVHRRVEGRGMLLGLVAGAPSTSYNFGATLAQDNVIAGTGRARWDA